MTFIYLVVFLYRYICISGFMMSVCVCEGKRDRDRCYFRFIPATPPELGPPLGVTGRAELKPVY